MPCAVEAMLHVPLQHLTIDCQCQDAFTITTMLSGTVSACLLALPAGTSSKGQWLPQHTPYLCAAFTNSPTLTQCCIKTG